MVSIDCSNPLTKQKLLASNPGNLCATKIPTNFMAKVKGSTRFGGVDAHGDAGLSSTALDGDVRLLASAEQGHHVLGHVLS